MRWIGLLILIALVIACGHRVEPDDLGLYRPAHPLVEQYSRNQVVCVPTLVGNVVGAIPVLPFIALYQVWHPGYPRGPVGRVGVETLETLFMTSVLLGGAVTGTLFLPVSYLAPESYCGGHP